MFPLLCDPCLTSRLPYNNRKPSAAIYISFWQGHLYDFDDNLSVSFDVHHFFASAHSVFLYSHFDDFYHLAARRSPISSPIFLDGQQLSALTTDNPSSSQTARDRNPLLTLTMNSGTSTNQKTLIFLSLETRFRFCF